MQQNNTLYIYQITISVLLCV